MAQQGLAAMVDQLAHHKMQLQIGHRLLGLATDKAAGFGEIAGQHAPALMAPAVCPARHS